MLEYSFHALLLESIDTEVSNIHRDHSLEQMMHIMLPASMKNSVSVMYTDDMNDNGLRLLKFKNDSGHTEYHIHNNNTFMPGRIVGENPKGATSALRLIYQDAKKEVESGNPVMFQSPPNDPERFEQYKFIAERVAKRHNKHIEHIGNMPFASAPFLSSPSILIR